MFLCSHHLHFSRRLSQLARRVTWALWLEAIKKLNFEGVGSVLVSERTGRNILGENPLWHVFNTNAVIYLWLCHCMWSVTWTTIRAEEAKIWNNLWVSHELTFNQSSPFRQFKRKVTPSVRHFSSFFSILYYCQLYSFHKTEGNYA